MLFESRAGLVKAIPSTGRPSMLFNPFSGNGMDAPYKPGSSSISQWLAPSATASSIQNVVQEHIALITTPPELRLREAIPEPQNGANSCSQAEQSASQAIQQASQQASDSVRQASGQFSQSADAASRSASQAIQQAQQSASQAIQQATQSMGQSVSAASRTMSAAQQSASQAAASASSAISSAQSSAAQAISQANASAQSAQSAASEAVLQAGAAVAAATGKAAAAGSSFLAAAGLATQSAQASVSALGAAAASQVAQASQQATVSQTLAITATQIAIAIVGSIIASALLTILFYFLVTRHRKKAKKAKKQNTEPDSPIGEYSKDVKFDAASITSAGSEASYTPKKASSRVSLFHKDGPRNQRSSSIKSTAVPWNPSNPPKPPSLGSWLRVQDGVSPFGPIKLSTDRNSNSPLGGQLKSPLRSVNKKPESPKAPAFVSNAPTPSPKVPGLGFNSPPTQQVRMPNLMFRNPAPSEPARQNSVGRKPISSERGEIVDRFSKYDYRDSKASIWTDDVVGDVGSPSLPSPPVTITQAQSMTIPAPTKPVRTTVEWLQGQAEVNAPQETRRPSMSGLPGNPRLTGQKDMARDSSRQSNAGGRYPSGMSVGKAY